MPSYRALMILFVVNVGSLVACERRAAPVQECSSGNYRAAPNGVGVCQCVNYRWECNEGSGAGVSGAADGSAEAPSVPRQSP